MGVAGTLLIGASWTTAFGTPAWGLERFAYWPVVAVAMLLSGISLIVIVAKRLGASERAEKDRQTLAAAESRTNVAVERANRAESTFNAQRAKEEELTSVRSKIARLEGDFLATMTAQNILVGGPRNAEIKALKERARELETEIRNLSHGY
jgi:predicted  nucleic acid-binding Zn-ribbon protein